MAEPAPRHLILQHAPDDDGAEKISVSLTRSMLRRIDDFHHGKRHPSRSAAIAALIEEGLKARQWERKQ